MREKLQQVDGRRITVTATVSRFGVKKGYMGHPDKPTICLVDVRDMHGKLVCDHLWVVMGKRFQELHLVEGDKVKFDGLSSPYRKRVSEWYDEDAYATDYALKYPTNVRRISGTTAEGDAPQDGQISMFDTPHSHSQPQGGS